MVPVAITKEVVIISGAPPIIAACLPDGELGATLRSMCDLMGISRVGQIQRIRRNSSLTDAIRDALVKTAGGQQQAEILLSWAISIWITGLQVSRLSEEKRAVALELQRGAFAAIEQAFVQKENKTSVPPAPSQPPIPQSVWQDWRAVIDRMETEYRVIPDIQNRLTVMRYDLQSYVQRLAAVEAKDAKPGEDLSPEHLKYLFELARQLQQRRGLSGLDVQALLIEHFRVEDVSALPEKKWPAVLDWFASLLEE